ncbi:hypothetical protein [Streptomyces pacificus]|uniref:Uncharacterized protein n=1 Tax=Streptomyces pacificus TaxID=2705029 RepID=A0A6A0AX07_9ACTN|nr:hypothetical protein [Streptomyces pacificus]GFH36965.1 hypothetical protein SCWH03_31980 [Streptomyces pacificus]
MDEVAEHGAPRRATGYRAANVVLRARDGREMDTAVATVAVEISALFAADGLLEADWIENF